MKRICPCCPQDLPLSEQRTRVIVKTGHYYRTSDRKIVQRYFCKLCLHHFSAATFSACYRQKKRHINSAVAKLLAANVSLRESARVLGINKKTSVRKMIFMGNQAQLALARLNRSLPRASEVQFDDIETFEHTKCKPLSITLAVESATRRILGFRVARMPAKGLLAKVSVKKYGKRSDERGRTRTELFRQLQGLVDDEAHFSSDECPQYPRLVKVFFPKAEHRRFQGRDPSLGGQGELKKIVFDPLFALNHTAATLRARTSRLIRRTWCTTKRPERLNLHLALVCWHHNLRLKSTPLSTA